MPLHSITRSTAAVSLEFIATGSPDGHPKLRDVRVSAGAGPGGMRVECGDSIDGNDDRSPDPSSLVSRIAQVGLFVPETQ